MQLFCKSLRGDLLTSYNGSVITYDAIGNPLSYRGKTFTWEGRRLVSAVNSSKTITFEYNDEGIRTSKTVNGVTTSYYLNGSQIMAEETNGNITVYLYNNTGIIGFQYRASTYAADVWDTYFYEKNLQGDIIAVYTADGVKKLSYTYDAWGNFTVTYLNGANLVTMKTLFAYRGYYYDSDLGFYYLNSRYYDSNTCRFINADGQLNTGSMLGYNLFAYCENNPVIFVDPNGDFLLIGLAATASIFFVGILLLPLVKPCGDVLSNAWQKAKERTEAVKTIVDVLINSNYEAKEEEKDKAIVKPGQKPEEKDGYIAPKGGPVKGKTKDGKIGWKDKNGNIWVPAPTGSSQGHGGGHWDVQSPKGGYLNVYPGGKIRGGKLPYPNIPILP